MLFERRIYDGDMILLKTDPDKFWDKFGNIEPYDFVGVTNFYIDKFTIPEKFANICEEAFAYSDFFGTVILPESMCCIRRKTFCSSSIKRITLPKDVIKIESNAFGRCEKLGEVIFNEKLKEICDFAFQDCAFKSLVFPKSLETIREFAFYECKQLESIEFPENALYGYLDKNIDENAFCNCTNLKTIKIGKQVIQLNDNQIFKSLSKNHGRYFIIVFNEGKKKNAIITDGQKKYTIKDWIYNIYENDTNFIENLIIWHETKQQSSSKAVQNSRLPDKYIIEAIGKNKQLINAYYYTKSNGVDLLEKSQWFQDLDNLDKTSIINLFGLLGGFEDNASHQKRIVEFLGTMVNTLNKKMGSDWKIVFCNEFLSTINLDLIKEEIIEYAHDKDNKIIMENGFPKIKAEKVVNYQKQILTLLEKCVDHEKFLRFLGIMTKEYPNIYKTYRKTLANLNPKRNPNSTQQKYDEFKQKGIDMDFVLQYFTEQNFDVKNEELKPVIVDLTRSAQNQKTIASYDDYLTEAKQIAQSAISANTRTKMFVENVVDNSFSRLKYVWPPITSAVALTIGDRFNTCYSVDGMNEAGLVNVITNPQDWIILIMNEQNNPIAYCRVNYDEYNRGILIDNIELDKNIKFSDEEKKEIWHTCVRALKDMKIAMNEEGKYPVERINCKPDPFNKVFNLIFRDYPKFYTIKAKKLEEREYEVSGERNIKTDYYYGSYDARSVSQIVIDSPELDNINQTEK